MAYRAKRETKGRDSEKMKINFIGRTKTWFAVSALLVAISVIAVVVRGVDFGIEFKGGTEIVWRPSKNVQIPDIRNSLKPVNLEKSVIQKSGKDFIIRTQRLTEREQKNVEKILKDKTGGRAESVQSVGAAWGREITRTSLIALALSMVGLLTYISIRFEYKMAVSAITALIHDIIITIGVYALVGREVTPATIAALLTILGYSLYDTIVVFHRIVENERKSSRKLYSEIANDSLNQVLVRSINTSVTTLIPIMSILLLGGETLKDFAFALFVGIVASTYSSIFVATPLISLWKEKEPKYAMLKKRLSKKVSAKAV